MPDRASFLEAIRQAPEDAALRLVFADWLDEHYDPTLAEFIRVQCGLEPLRDNSEDERAKELRQREEELLRQHRAAWLGPLEALAADWGSHASFTFRRGLVEAVATTAEVFIEEAEELERSCPALH